MTYQPINCDFYDRLEAAATLRQTVDLRLTEASLVGATAQGRIVDLYIKEGAEWLKLADGTEIRLDWLQAMNGESVPTHC